MKTTLTAQQVSRGAAWLPNASAQPSTLQLKINNSQRVVAASNFCSQLQSKKNITNQSVIQQKSDADVIQRARVSYFSSKYSREARNKRINQVIGGRNLATAKVYVNGVRRYITRKSKGIHSEARIKRKIDQLIGMHGAHNVDVRWLYSELKPCGSDYHNCRHRVANWFPGVPVHYSLSYPQRGGITTATAKRRRARASAALKRFNTRLRQINNGTAAAPVNANNFAPPLRRVNSDPNLFAGFTL